MKYIFKMEGQQISASSAGTQKKSAEEIQLEEMFFQEWIDKLRTKGLLKEEQTSDQLIVTKGSL